MVGGAGAPCVAIERVTAFLPALDPTTRAAVSGPSLDTLLFGLAQGAAARPDVPPIWSPPALKNVLP